MEKNGILLKVRVGDSYSTSRGKTNPNPGIVEIIQLFTNNVVLWDKIIHHPESFHPISSSTNFMFFSVAGLPARIRRRISRVKDFGLSVPELDHRMK